MALRDRIMTAIGTLGLYGMKSTLDEILAAGIKSRATPEKIICDLLEAELAERKVRSIRYRMGLARFPVDKDLDRFDFNTSPVNEMQIRSLHEGRFLAYSGPCRPRFRRDGDRHSGSKPTAVPLMPTGIPVKPTGCL